MTPDSDAQHTSVRPGRRLTYAAAAMALFFPVVITTTAWHHAVDVPYWDQWNWLDRLYGAGGAFDLRRYWPLLNEHRVVVPLAIDWLLFEAIGVDMRVRALLKVPITLVSLVALVALFRYTVRDRGTRHEASCTAAAAVVFSALLFPASYWPVWFDPRNYAVHMAHALTILSVVLIGTRARRWGTWTAAAVCSALASLTTTVGALAWPAGLALLWWRRYPVGALVLWLAAAAAIVTPHALDILASIRSTEAAAPSAREALKFVLAFAGRPVSPSVPSLRYWPSMAAGAFGLLVLAASLARTVRQARINSSRMAPWYVLAAWAVSIAGMIAAGRAASGGPDVVHDARFVAVATPLWIVAAALALLPEPVPAPVRSRWSQAVRTGAWVVALAGYTTAGLGAVLGPRSADLSLRLATGRRCIADVATAPDACLQLLHPVPDFLRQLVPVVAARPSRLSSPAAPRWLRESWGDRLSFDIRPEPAALPLERSVFAMRNHGDVDRVPIRDGDTVRFPALRLRAPSAAKWRIRVPDAGFVSVVSAVRAAGGPLFDVPRSDLTPVRLVVTSRHGRRHAWERQVRAGEGRFTPAFLDLTPLAGEDVEFVLQAGDLARSASLTGGGRVEWLHPDVIVAPGN